MQNRTLILSDPSNIRMLPINQQIEELCEIAVRKDGNTLKYIENQTENICIYAIMQTYDALKYVKNQTPSLCELAISFSAYAFMHIKKPTLKFYWMAIKRDPNAKRDIYNYMEKNGEIPMSFLAIVI